MSTITATMREEGVIYIPEEKHNSQSAGRKPEKLFINDQLGYIIGYDIQASHVTLTAVDIYYHKITSKHYHANTHKNHLESLFFELLTIFTAEPELHNKFLIGISVGITGIIDIHKQVVTRSLPLGVIDEPYDFHAKISQKSNVPVLLGNDANCCATSILAKYRTDNHKNFLFIYIYYKPEENSKGNHMRLGVGIGIVINHNLYLGEDGYAGEFRSLQSDPKGERQFSLNKSEIDNLVSDNAVLEKFIDELIVNISTPINMLNLNTVFIGGDLDFTKSNLASKIIQGIKKTWPYQFKRNYYICILDKDEDLIAYSAAGVFLQHLFSDPDTSDALDFKQRCWNHILKNKKS